MAMSFASIALLSVFISISVLSIEGNAVPSAFEAKLNNKFGIQRTSGLRFCSFLSDTIRGAWPPVVAHHPLQPYENGHQGTKMEDVALNASFRISRDIYELADARAGRAFTTENSTDSAATCRALSRRSTTVSFSSTKVCVRAPRWNQSYEQPDFRSQKRV